jgi:hypothetical protein
MDGLLGFAIVVGLSGCSIHPLPGDIPRVSTGAIVERIRCEAQEGLRSFPLDDPRIKQIIRGTKIGYNFEFTITEGENDASGQLRFERPDAIGGSFVLDVTPSARLTRKNIRSFFLQEDLTKLNSANCSPEASRANWVYPVTGAAGMAEVIQTYIRLQMLAGLKLGAVTDPVFSDTLTFTTNWMAGSTATLQLNTFAGSFRLEKASITGTASRLDKHDVTVALAYDGPPTAGGRNFTLAKSARKAWMNNARILESRDLRRLVQSDADASDRVVYELARRRRIREDFTKVGKLLGTVP